MVELSAASGLLAVTPNPSVDRLLDVDRLERGMIHRPTHVTVVPGGKGLNMARAAASLGVRVRAVGLLGGRAGDWICDQLKTEGMDVVAVRRTAETRTCTSILDREDGTTTEFYESGEPIDPTEWDRFLDAIQSSLAGEDCGFGLVSVSGSLPPDAPDDGLADIIEIARSAELPTAIDAHGLPLTRALRARPSLVKVNLAEARAALSTPRSVSVRALDPGAEAADCVRSLLDAGALEAVVTIGRDGAVAGLRGRLFRVRPPRLGPYPVGAGDAFFAGLAVAALEGLGDEAGLVLATAAAAASALVPGAGRLHGADVERLRAEVVVEQIQ